MGRAANEQSDKRGSGPRTRAAVGKIERSNQRGTIMSREVSKQCLGADPAVRRYEDIRQLIANPENPTPMVRVNHIVPAGDYELFLKLEWYNPFGSIKDRAAYYMLREMERRGQLEGRQIVEPTSGNTGIALAAIAALMGKRITVTIPDGVPEEKITMLRMLGAEVWPTPDDLCPVDHPKDGAIALALSFVRGEATKDQYCMPYQYENPENVRAHYENTGPEIWKQTEGRVEYFFAGFGTCGTLSGVGRFLKEQNPDVKIIAVEPRKGHRLPGLKNLEESKPPGILDRSVIDEVVRIEDDDAYEMTKQLFRKEGLIVGPTTGAIVHVATQFAGDHKGLAVAISPDGGFKYTSYFTELLGDEGLVKA